MVVVDGEIIVLGSGNMDRASWFTSQELGVALLGRVVAERIRGAVDEGLEERVGYVC
jgi:phosphatidylserine/phosphatidylglycerophosphate/cardiolipin synthase-like enzyme